MMWVKQGNELLKAEYVYLSPTEFEHLHGLYFEGDNRTIKLASEFSMQIYDMICKALEKKGDNVYADLDYLIDQLEDENYIGERE